MSKSALPEQYKWVIGQVAFFKGGIVCVFETEAEAQKFFDEKLEKTAKIETVSHDPKNPNKFIEGEGQFPGEAYKIFSREEFSKLPNWRTCHPAAFAQADFC